MKIIDFIGDIHGHADKLEELLIRLGYSYSFDKGCYAHPGRQAVFVGDYIDRGPKIRETLRLVRGMVENAGAIALLGNHEYNALCFHLKNNNGGHLREHSIQNIIQHYETLRQFQNRQKEYEDYMKWYMTLPLFYETESFRVVHACWDNSHIELLKKRLNVNCLTEELIYEAELNKKGELDTAIDETLKGREIKLPGDIKFSDKDGASREKIRIKWWEDIASISATYENISIEPLENLPKTNIELAELKFKSYYTHDEKPVFFGHYWLKGNPSIYRDNVCCLDYSVAKHGKLVAYSLNEAEHTIGKLELSNSRLTYV